MRLPPILPRDLVPIAKLLEKDEPRLLVVVGTGISLGATDASHASWLGLLKHGVKHLVETEVFTERRGNDLSATLDRAFAPFDLEAALQHAELVEQNLKTPDTAAFARWLEAAFSDFKIQSKGSETLDAIRDLERAGALLLTTNYDSLLSEATGLPPVTWEEHTEFYQVIRRQHRGILHVHGHWQRPSSVVLGRSSYDRIARDHDFQDLFKDLWLERSWLYVGCGNGLGDPNLGRLLEWGKRWKKDTPSDYFLAESGEALALADRPDRPANLVYVGYPDHPDLPNVLHSLTPRARCLPFSPVDKDFSLFRSPVSPVSIPFPSQQEYLDGAVPAFSADVEVRSRLEKHGWAFVLDVASVGKTTLALRMASAPEQRDHPTFYLDLAKVDADDSETDAGAALRRLSRPSSLLILDNVHHEPELARRLWDQWQQRPSGSRLLLVSTRTQRAAVTAPAQDLGFFEHYASNPAVELRPTPGDLRDIVKHLYTRVGGPEAPALPVIPESALQRWHHDYGNALGAFCLAALGRLAEFQRDRWELPLESASDWVREKWLDNLDAGNRENVLCLAVFGNQELELQVQSEALPHPGQTGQLLRLGLVTKTQSGQLGQYLRFSLREPDWGRLLLAAQIPAVDEEKILFETAARHPTAVLSLSGRLRRNKSLEPLRRLWASVAINPQNFIGLIQELPLTYVPSMAKAAKDGQQPLLADLFWEVIEREPDKFAERAWEAQLQFVTLFLDTAKRHHRNTTPLWEAIEREPAKIAERAWGAPLDFVASFLDTAKRQGRNTTPLWEAIEREPDRFVERAWEAPLDFVALFLDTAKRHQRNTTPLWEAIEREPDRFAERAWETQLHFLAFFLDTARRHQRNTAPLWEAIEREPDKLAERVWDTPLNDVGSFLDTARRHQRNTAPLWEAIEREPDKLAERVWDTPLNDVGSFLDTARRHQRNTAPLWEAIESEPDKLAKRAWETPLGSVASYLETAKQHGRDTGVLWAAMESNPDKLAERAWGTSLEHVASFLDTAKQHGRDTSTLWAALERNPERLAERAWETSLGQVASFLGIAKQHGRDIEGLVQALESRPVKLSRLAKESTVSSLVGFCHYAPDTLVKIALAEFKTSDWDGVPISRALVGATWVAARCGTIGREDLASALLSTLLRRANPRDFPPETMGLANVAWLLKHVPPAANPLVPTFLETLCTKRWLGGLFTNAPLGPVATGLRMLALHQAPLICRRFQNPSLGIRVQNELMRFADVVQEEQSQIIQLLGCATLFGSPAKSAWFNNVYLSAVATLPVDTLPHRADMNKVESWQFQLWLGLRAVTEVTGKALEVPSEVIVRTLDLWRSNFAETSINAESAEHRVNESMVSWLEGCSRGSHGLLPPVTSLKIS